MCVSWLLTRRDPRTRGSSAICLMESPRKKPPLTPPHCEGALEAGVLHVAGIDISTLGSHFQQHKDLENPVPVPIKCDRHSTGCLQPMYRMMFLKGVHVTQAGPMKIFPKMVKTRGATLDTYNRHTQRNRDEIKCVLMREMQKIEWQKETKRYR